MVKNPGVGKTPGMEKIPHIENSTSEKAYYPEKLLLIARIGIKGCIFTDIIGQVSE